jgi:hypothetical protein
MNMRVGRIAVLLLAAAALAGCDSLSGVVTTGPVAQSVAETNARMSSGVSLASVEVVSSRLSTYGAEQPGGSLRAPDAQVWAVVLSGAFPYGSCLITIPGFGSPAPTPAKPCPAPALRERVLLDANSGRVIVVIPGG